MMAVIAADKPIPKLPSVQPTPPPVEVKEEIQSPLISSSESLRTPTPPRPETPPSPSPEKIESPIISPRDPTPVKIPTPEPEPIIEERQSPSPRTKRIT